MDYIRVNGVIHGASRPKGAEVFSPFCPFRFWGLTHLHVPLLLAGRRAFLPAPWRRGLQRNIEYNRITYNIRVVVFNPWCKGAASRFSTKTGEGVSDMMRSSSGAPIDAAVRFLCVQWTPEKTRSEKLRKVS